ncbi:MAG: GspH/FimT family pseudopilin [Gammaproteobacteria bacterium]|nr:GspH/FimT family pseudopilin [Gammaproteobacteria bacterium]
MNTPRETGFTLLELMVAIAITGALTAVAIPSLSSWVQNSRIDSAAQTLSAGILLARSEAVSRNRSILLTSPVNAIAEICIADPDEEKCDSSLDDNLISLIELPGTDITIDSDEAGSDGLRFNPRGRLDEAARSALYTICDSRGEDSGVRLDINSVGRVVIQSLDAEAGDKCDTT